MDKEREWFEEWWLDFNEWESMELAKECGQLARSGEGYEDLYLNWMWEAWLARANKALFCTRPRIR